MSSMKCTIPGVNLKVFGRAIQSLSKIGDELYFEPLEDGLYLRTVNSCRSAYGYFQFSPSFFLHYIDGSSGQDGRSSDEEGLRCKIGMKSVMAVFKSLPTIDKTVEKCRISLNMSEARLIFQMYCRHGIIKTHNLAFIECDTLQAVFSKDLCPNKITAPPKLLCDAVLNFQSTQEEITLIVRPDFLALKNYVEDEPDITKVIHTEMTLSPDEFDHYQVGVDTEVTFCLKELRAILSFVDITDLPLCLHFECAGRPVTISISSDLSFEGNFVLATLADVGNSSQQRLPSQTTQRQPQGHTTKRPRNTFRRPESNTQSQQRTVNGGGNRDHSQAAIAPSRSNAAAAATASNALCEEMDDNDDEELSHVMNVTTPEDSISENIPELRSEEISQVAQLGMARASHSALGGNNECTEDNDMQNEDCVRKDRPLSLRLQFSSRTDDDENLALTDDGNTGLNDPLRSTSPPSTHAAPGRQVLSLRSLGAESPDTSPQIPLQTETFTTPNLELADQSDEEDEDEIPGTPPSKKFRALLFGTQSSTQPSQSQRRPEILALDSDEDS
ncbi:cell cycle checkpoint control protein RAD9A [Aplysia californica]|uniref:Cell cycle checkpoint control protein RAD9A n=1 Tax=Aplysia californica TaxID=6500 RepID=A0ABM0JVR2_APLCA|nr:cell cycle checkpoint control protein RAD9A [Aplysia californica]